MRPQGRPPPQRPIRRKTTPMSRPAVQRLSFFLLMGVTLYASLFGAG
ncbi:hypothetical protein [Paracoccus salipaludis]|nr:hypothetical protein [Paracoccus salipaludis]